MFLCSNVSIAPKTPADRGLADRSHRASTSIAHAYSTCAHVDSQPRDNIIDPTNANPSNVAHGDQSLYELQFTMDANVGAAIFKKGASLEATTASLSDPRSSYDTYSYTVSKGAIIDVSWKGTSARQVLQLQ